METGDFLPEIPVQQIDDNGDVQQVNLREFCSGKTVILVGTPGAFTPTCSKAHVPGYFAKAAALQAKGVDAVVVVVAVDYFVVRAWADKYAKSPLIEFMADGSGRFTKAVKMEADLGDVGLGMRSQRYAAVIRNGKVEALQVEPKLQVATITCAESMLELL